MSEVFVPIFVINDKAFDHESQQVHGLKGNFDGKSYKFFGTFMVQKKRFSIGFGMVEILKDHKMWMNSRLKTVQQSKAELVEVEEQINRLQKRRILLKDALENGRQEKPSILNVEFQTEELGLTGTPREAQEKSERILAERFHSKGVVRYDNTYNPSKDNKVREYEAFVHYLNGLTVFEPVQPGLALWVLHSNGQKEKVVHIGRRFEEIKAMIR